MKKFSVSSLFKNKKTTENTKHTEKGIKQMFQVVFQSSVYIFDIEQLLKNKRRKKLLLGWKSYLVDCPIGFYIL
jgi:hypothetical protein